MRNPLRRFNEAFEEGTLAFSDRIFGLTDDDLWDNDLDEDVEAALASGDFREPARSR